MSERSATETPATQSQTPRLDSAMVGHELIAELRSTLERAGELIRVVEANLQQSPAPGQEETASSDDRNDRVTELERRLATAESDVKELASRLVLRLRHHAPIRADGPATQCASPLMRLSR